MSSLTPSPTTSFRMARVRQKGTKIETIVGEVLRSHGLHYRRNVGQLPGSPDFANRTHKWAVFVNGCFWHRHTGCSKATIPKSNTEFWTTKFRANRTRDARAIRLLRKEGFRVVIVWECQRDRLCPRLRKILEARRVNPR
jgi:DNA mismatch endonuclease Vsr